MHGVSEIKSSGGGAAEWNEGHSLTDKVLSSFSRDNSGSSKARLASSLMLCMASNILLTKSGSYSTSVRNG